MMRESSMIKSFRIVSIALGLALTTSSVAIESAHAGGADSFSMDISSGTHINQDMLKGLTRLENESSVVLTPEELAQFKALLEKFGWPTYESGGVKGINSAARLLYRAGSDPLFQSEVLHDLDPRVGVDVDPVQFARLSDEISLNHNGTQTYGTILSNTDDNGLRPEGVLKNEGARLFFRDFYGMVTLKEEIEASDQGTLASPGFDGSQWSGELGRMTPNYTRPDIRNELGRMISDDQSARTSAIRAKGNSRKDLMDKVAQVDKDNLDKVETIFRNVGFPTVEMVGRDGVSTAFLLVQHADSDPAFQERALNLAKPLMEKRELSRRQYAYLVDRVRLAKGEKQLYGSQVTTKSGKAAPLPLVDPEHVDERRAEMLMGSEQSYLDSIDSRAAAMKSEGD